MTSAQRGLLRLFFQPVAQQVFGAVITAAIARATGAGPFWLYAAVAWGATVGQNLVWWSNMRLNREHDTQAWAGFIYSTGCATGILLGVWLFVVLSP